MNPYQKAAALVFRIVGTILVVIGLMGPLYVGALQAMGRSTPSYPQTRWMGSITWIIGGALLVAGAKPLGRRIGGGLE